MIPLQRYAKTIIIIVCQIFLANSLLGASIDIVVVSWLVITSHNELWTISGAPNLQRVSQRSRLYRPGVQHLW